MDEIDLFDDDTDRLWPLSDFDQHHVWAMVEGSPDGMLLADEHGTILLVNAQIEAMFGYDRGDLIGRPVEELLPERHRQIHTAHRIRYRAEPTIRAMGNGLDLSGQRKDGTEFPAEVSLSPVTGPDGLCVVASVRDISDRVEIEAHTHAVLHTIDETEDGVFMFTPDALEFVYVNQGAVTQLGYTQDELLAMTPLHIKPEFTEATFRELLSPLLAGDVTSITVATIHRTKNGADYPVEIILQYPPAPATGPRMLVALVRDISRRVEAEQQLAASEAAFRSAFEWAPVGMVTAHIGGSGSRIIDRVNEVFATMLGRTVDELIGSDLAELTHPDDDAADVAAIAAFDQRHTAYVTEKRYLNADGTYRWCLLNAVSLGDRQDRRILAHVLDISERRAAETERDRQRRWLQGLAEIRNHILNDSPLDQALDLVCKHAADIVTADMAAIGTPDQTWACVELSAWRGGFFDHLDTPRIPVGPGLRSVLETKRPAMFETGPPPGAEEFVTAEVGPSIIVPLLADGDLGGVLLLARNPGKPPFSNSDVQLIESFAHQANTALERARIRNDRERLVVLEDRERLAQDLHDLVIQRLFAAGMGLQAVHGLITENAAAKRVMATVDELDETIAELRAAIFHLNNPTPDTVASRLADIISHSETTLGYRPSLTIHGDPETIRETVAEELIPTITEALSNVARHANATTTDITLTTTDDLVELIVADNGDGYQASNTKGNGLANLRDRADRLGGTMTITLNPHEGTTLTWTARRLIGLEETTLPPGPKRGRRSLPQSQSQGGIASACRALPIRSAQASMSAQSLWSPNDPPNARRNTLPTTPQWSCSIVPAKLRWSRAEQASMSSVTNLGLGPRIRRAKGPIRRPKKVLVSPRELTLYSHVGLHANAGAWSRTRSAAGNSQVPLWIALPTTKA